MINSLSEFKVTSAKALENPDGFWSEVASEFHWKSPWKQTLDYDFSKPEVKWFVGGKLNITENCLDRHLATQPNKTAILFEPNDPTETAQHITYKELHKRVCQTANMLMANGAKKGDRICIYMPMVPELAIAVLACARIGAIHSVVFAGFSATALAARINDASCSMLLTADGGFRGAKTIALKEIADDALTSCSTVNCCLVLQRTQQEVQWNSIDKWWHEELEKIDDNCPAEVMDSEDPLFILYTSGSTGKPKGMVHTCGGYMVYTAYTFKNVFQCQPNDVYWCTADIGWITGHSYIVYGPLANGATTVMFEGVPSYPAFDRFWEVCAKHNITHFYTAPTAIRALEKHPTSLVEKHDLSSLKVLGSVGEPINAEAWHWYDKHVGKHNCPIVDTWWQTETGGILISSLAGVTPQKPTFATLPMPGVQTVLLNNEGDEIEGEGEGILAIKHPWPSIARTIWGDHERYKNVYFSAYPGYYFPGDGALRDAEGNFRITGRVDDVVIVSGHNLGTAPIENAINEHPNVVESAVVGFPHDVKGNALHAFAIVRSRADDNETLKNELRALVAKTIGPIAKPDRIQVVSGLPKTRSGKIMRRILRKLAAGEYDQLGDVSTLLNPEVVEEIKQNK
ncbi:MAG: acetate--CoA ligase [Flavobacteriaceae bacterium]|nr:acetate--CoA ligase [Flavobacteriaceae bacterium]